MTRDTQAASHASRLYARVVGGDLTGAASALRDLAARDDPLARAWGLALRAQLWLTAPARVALPEHAELAPLVDAPAEARSVALVCAADLALARTLRFEGDELARLATLADTLARGADERAGALAALVRAYAAVVRRDGALDGERAGARDDARDVVTAAEAAREAARVASSERLASALVAATALSALAALDAGDDGAALERARRASLMGRSEGLPHAELFAHLCLVRARRVARQPHLALRVAAALRPFATPPWRAWLAWEWTWAGGGWTTAAADLEATPACAARSASTSLTALLGAARAGERAGFERSAAALGASTASASFAAREIEELIAAIDPRRPAPTRALDAWRAGQTVLTPGALHGLRLRPDGDEEDTAAAYVYAERGGGAARLLHWGAPLIAGDVAHVKQSPRVEGRMETLLAVVALAGAAGIEEERGFHETYGFAFAPAVHRGVFDVLVHRARAAVQATATLERRDGRLYLVATRAMLIPDPRVSQRTTDRVLRLLAQRGIASAKDAADDLGVSLRTAQGALKELTAVGACEARRDGRNVGYAVEDTVFSEPTRRLLADELSGLSRFG